MSSAEVLQRAIQVAREGRKTEARDLLIELVDVDPRNEMAWMWLAGLADSIDDRIIACENVLTINPDNQKARTYLEQLRRRKQSLLENKNRNDAADLLNLAKKHAELKETDIALRFARQALEKNDDYEEAWLFIARMDPDMDQQIAALEKARQLNPSNREIVSRLEQLRHLKVDPISAARQLEQLGQFEEALKAYHELASKARNSREFDQIYKQILRIEGLQNEKIRYVAPSTSIIRLTFVWPLLYLSLALVQMGLNPFAHPSFYSCLGLPLVAIGSFLLSLSEVRSAHVLWQKLFDEQGDGSQFARLVTATAGCFFVIIPHILLFFDSLNRLRNFTIPSMPF